MGYWAAYEDSILNPVDAISFSFDLTHAVECLYILKSLIQLTLCIFDQMSLENKLGLAIFLFSDIVKSSA